VGPVLDQGPAAGRRAVQDAFVGYRGMSRAGETVWEVFARKEYAEPLHHVGTVTEDDEDLALVSARAIYDEQPWIEMIIVPRVAIREAIRS
jgi:1,2-phenylacetyl-CoA epoxidase PaaB subunit